MEAILAHERDPCFPSWPDAVPLNYGNEQLQEALIVVRKDIASQCDGVRCDTAMLVLPDILERSWERKTKPFWHEATSRVRQSNQGFICMIEVYWDLEWTLTR